jgi:hypothetical protein
MIVLADQGVPESFTNVFKLGALKAASGVTKLSISRFRILAVSEIIEVEVLIAPLISSSKSTLSRNAVAVAPLPFPPVILTAGADVTFGNYSRGKCLYSTSRRGSNSYCRL